MSKDLRTRLLSLDLDVKGERVEKIVDFLRIDRSKIEIDAYSIAEEYFFWHSLAEEADEYYRAVDIKFSIWEARQDKKIRSALDAEGMKVTESAVNRQIKLVKGDKGEMAGEFIWSKYKERMNKAKKAASTLRGLVEAIRMKKEMIKSFIDKGKILEESVSSSEVEG